MNSISYIVVMGLFFMPIPLHGNERENDDLQNKGGFWATTCFGNSIFIDLGDSPKRPDQDDGNNLNACHVICRNKDEKIKQKLYPKG